MSNLEPPKPHHFPNLEPNHSAVPNIDGDIVVLCPFEVTDEGLILHTEPRILTATWFSEAEADEIECPVCEVLNGKLYYLGSPDCEDEDGE